MKYILKRLSLLFIVLISDMDCLYSQSITEISGSVKDKSNEPLIGANVFIYKTMTI